MNDQSTFKLSAAIVLVTLTCVTFSTISACGHKNQGTDGQPTQSDDGHIGTAGIIHAQQLAREAQVTCADSRNCPENVAMVISTRESGVDLCTGFLIAPDLVMTSLSCIPADLRADDSACSSRIRVQFPAGNNQSLEGGDCSRINVYEGESHAYIRLAAPVSRRALSISGDGLVDGVSMSVPVVNPTSRSKPFGEIRELHCEVIQKSVVLPDFRSETAPLASLGHCAVGSSNLGAPVIDTNGNVRAIVKSGFQGMEQLEKAYPNLLQQNALADFAIVSNLACILTPVDKNRSLPGICSTTSPIPPTGLARIITPEILKSAHEAVQKSLDGWKTAHFQKLHWTAPAPVMNLPLRFQPGPVCFSGSQSWLGEYRSFLGRIFGSGYSSDAKEELLFPTFTVTYTLDSMGRTVPHYSQPELQKVIMSFNPRQLVEKGSSPLKITFKDRAGVLFQTANLNNCKQ